MVSLSWKRLMAGLTIKEMGKEPPAGAWILEWYEHEIKWFGNVTHGNVSNMPPLVASEWDLMTINTSDNCEKGPTSKWNLMTVNTR
jgi:hypothetical protein